MESLLTMPGIILVSGPKGSGKTHFIKNIIHSLAKRRKFDYLKVMCPTSYNGAYSYIPKRHLIEGYNEIVIHELLQEQIDLKKAGKTRKALLILDDCIGSANFKAQIWEKLATTCRHPNLTVVVVTQHIFRLPPTLRDNSDTVIILRTIDVDNLTGLYDTCGRWKWRKFGEFEDFVHNNTLDYKAIIINKGKSVRIVRAPATLRKFRLMY
jgi:uridine kinase